jgi:hypothetical protein
MYIKNHGSSVTIFSDEKIFTVYAVLNRRSDRYLAKSTVDVKGTFRTKHPDQVMVFGVLAFDGQKMPTVFYKPGEKVGADAYYKVLRYHVMSWFKANYPEGNYVLSQDGAPSHTNNKVQKFCKANFADFWPVDFWSSFSPDLNPLNYAVWGVLEQATNRPHSLPNINTLKAAIQEECVKMSKDFLVKSCFLMSC